MLNGEEIPFETKSAEQLIKECNEANKNSKPLPPEEAMAEEIEDDAKGGYIGDSTWSEIRYAYMTDKKIKSLVEIPGAEIKERAEDVIARAEVQAEHSIDALRHEGVYADLEMHPSFVFKGEPIYDPWVNEAANSAETDFSNHNDLKQAVEPFSYYGKQKVADFVERIIAIRNI